MAFAALARFGLALASLLAATPPAHAQPPALLWSNSLGAQIFAVDSQTNLYAAASNLVYIVNGAGSVVGTNSFCPLPALARLDNAGNFYFAGSFDGYQDFGGTTLEGGCTNCNGGSYESGLPTCFLAKYNSAGALQWVTQFGNPPGVSNRVDDLVLNEDGSMTVAFDGSGQAALAMFSASGSNMWLNSPSGRVPGDCFALTVSPLVWGQGVYLQHRASTLAGGLFNAAGIVPFFPPFFQQSVYWTSPLSESARPVVGISNNIFFGGMTSPPFPAPYLQENLFPFTVQVWNKSVSVEEWALAGDGERNFYVGGTNGIFAKYNDKGTQIWSTNYGPVVTAMLMDASGDSFIGFADGSIGRIGNPTSTAAPLALNVAKTGSSVVVKWPSNFNGVFLEWAPNFTGPWTNSPGNLTLSGTNLVVTNFTPGLGGFYRLRVP